MISLCYFYAIDFNEKKMWKLACIEVACWPRILIFASA
jgi:hypothetical protein